MKTTHLIRCSVGALSIFALAACESQNARTSRSADRDATGYPRNSGSSMERGNRGSSTPYRSDANWNQRDSNSGAWSQGDNRGMNATGNPTRTGDTYAGTMDRVDTRDPQWQSGVTTNSGTNTNQQGVQQRGWNGQQTGDSRQGEAARPTSTPSANVPTDSNAGTGYSDAQMSGQTNTQGTQQTSNTSNRDGNSSASQTDTHAGGGYTANQQTNQEGTPNNAGQGNTWNSPNQQQGQWNSDQRAGTMTRGTTSGGVRYTTKEYPMHAGTQQNRNMNQGNLRSDARDDTQANPDARRNNVDAQREQMRSQQMDSASRRDTYRGNDSWTSDGRSDSNWYVDGPDDRHDGGGYSPALINPERTRAWGSAWTRTLPRDSGAGTGYPMSWQRAAFRQRRENAQWDRGTRTERTGRSRDMNSRSNIDNDASRDSYNRTTSPDDNWRRDDRTDNRRD